MGVKRRTYSFVLVLREMSEGTGELEDALFEAGCDDALLGSRNGVVYLDFDREATTIENAMLSAIADVESTGIGARVVRVEPGDLVTAAEIARRLGKSREIVRLWTEGTRGPGDFPKPTLGITGPVLLWRWVEVGRWLARHGRLDDPEKLHVAEATVDMNAALELREAAADQEQGLGLLARIEGRQANVHPAR